MEDFKNSIPLAERIRPENIGDFLGQDDIIGEGKLLRQAIETDNIPSMILWGPPGSGKTTLASIIAKITKAKFITFSAVVSGVDELRKNIELAKMNLRLGQRTILFIDEIHRWNKTQQDALLPHVEKGTIILIGATTENLSFEVRGALLSRCRVFVLKQLAEEQLVEIIQKALQDKDRGLGKLKIKATTKIIESLAQMSNGDARIALNVLEYAISISDKLTLEIIKEAFQKPQLFYDKKGEEHHNIISALHKSMRGSSPDAALYWLVRMLKGGEDPLYIARRLIRFASEDIGLANSKALEQAVAVYQACHFIGMPECGVSLSQAVVYMAKCKKSNDLYVAYGKAEQDVEKYGNLKVPLHICNASTKLMKDLGYGKDYKYSPDHNYEEEQEYFPDKLKGRKYLKD